MRLLLDTHILVWLVRGDPRLSRAQREAIEEIDNELFVSPVVAYELTHLQQRKRIPLQETVDELQEIIDFELVGLPPEIWRSIAVLPDVHQDPIDRMLVAHAICSGMAIATADRNIRRYPVPVV